MTLVQDKIKDRIFELEMEQKEIQMCLTQAARWGNDEEFLSTQEYYSKLSQEKPVLDCILQRSFERYRR